MRKNTLNWGMVLMSVDRELLHEKITSNGKKIWYLIYTTGLLIEVDVETGREKYLGEIPGSENKKYAFRSFLYHEGKLYFAPYTTNKIVVYDIDNNSFTNYLLPEKYTSKYGEMEFIGICVVKNSLFLFGKKSVICSFDINSKNIQCVEIEAEGMKDGENALFWDCHCIIDNHLMIFLHGLSGFCDLDVDSMNYKFEIIGNELKEIIYKSVSYDGDYFWLSVQENTNYAKLIRWKRDNNSIKEFCLSEITNEVKKDVSFSLFIKNDTIFIIPINSRFSAIFNIKNGEIVKLDDFPLPNIDQISWPWCCSYTSVHEKENKLYMINMHLNKVVVVDMLRRSVEIIDILICEDVVNAAVIKNFSLYGIINETDYYDLNRFIKNVEIGGI